MLKRIPSLLQDWRAGTLARFTRPACTITLELQNPLAAWLWLASVARDNQERLFCLEKLLQINPDNPTPSLSDYVATSMAAPACDLNIRIRDENWPDSVRATRSGWKRASPCMATRSQRPSTRFPPDWAGW